MIHLFTFNQLFEKLQMVTTNWSIVSNEGSFEDKEGNGYLVFNRDGIFSIIYKKEGEEARIEFYINKEKSTDKKSVCECKIIKSTGKDKINHGYSDVTPDNVWDILVDFFDYSDLEKIDKNEVDRFLMGFTKSIKAVLKTDEEDQLPPSFKIFVKYINDWTNKSEEPSIDSDDYDFKNIINKFISYMKSDK